MEPAPSASYVVPNPRIPKVLGILNILFASGLMLCGLCSGAYVSMLPTLTKAMEQSLQQMQAQQDAQRKAALDAVAEEEKAAKTEQEKADVAARRREIESRPKVEIPMFNMKMMGMDDPKLMAYMWTDVATGLIINLLMLAAGIGLVLRSPWGLKLGFWVAALKIVRLVTIYSYFAVAVAPTMSMNLAKGLVEMMAQQQQAAGRPMPPGMDVGMLARTYTIMYTLYAVGLIVFGSIYPAVSLWLLSRPSARAACSRERGPREVDETW